MADALFITGSVDYDGSDWFTDDPLVVDVQVKAPDGSALSGADVTVALVPYDGDSTEALKTVQADADGSASVSLTASTPDIYEIQVGAQGEGREGYAQIGSEEAVPNPGFAIDPGPPTLTDATALTGQKTLLAEVTTDREEGTLYAVLDDGPRPTDMQIKNGEDSSGGAPAASKQIDVSRAGTFNVFAEGLEADTLYTAYFLHATSQADSGVASVSARTDADEITSITLSISDNVLSWQLA